MEIKSLIALFIIVFLGYWIQSIAGFGAVIFALPLSMFFIERGLFVPVALVMSIIQSGSIAIKDRKYIDKKIFLIMLFIAISGMPLGIFISERINKELANLILGIFIIGNSGYSLYKEYRIKRIENLFKKRYYVCPFLSGVLQTAYSAGGPLIGAYMDKVTEDKREYRATLSLYWCLLNPIILISYIVRGQVGINHIKLFFILIPATMLGYYLGNLVINKISQKKFKYLVNIMLVFIGFTLVVK